MSIVQIIIAPWDKISDFDAKDFKLKAGDKVVVRTEAGEDLGTVVSVFPGEVENAGEDGEKNARIVLRPAAEEDFKNMPDEKEKAEALKVCRELAKKCELPIKIIDVQFAYDNSKITFAFISDGRVDFRELAKNLIRYFGRTIRLQQIGIRDEAKFMGDYGHCGQKLCCKKFLKELVSITSEMSDIQQCSHRGSDRISGICGRLMCCLAYEQSGYTSLKEKMPEIGKKVSVDGKRGAVVGHNILKQTVNVEFPGEKGEGSVVVEVDLNRRKK